MAGKLIVLIGYILNPDETHRIVTCLADAADRKQFSNTVHHRDMNQVRCYYNGLLEGWSLARAGGERRVIELYQHGMWPYSRREFSVPALFVDEDYVGLEELPARLL